MDKFQKVVVIDGKDHLLGRLASVVAKQLLSGQNIVVLRCEALNISGTFKRNKLKFHAYLRKRCVVNPKRGAFHFRSPSKIFYKAVRGMVPRKTVRGEQALGRLKVFEGVPRNFEKVKRMVVPCALRALRLRPGYKYTVVGKLASQVGWKYNQIVTELESQRKERSQKYFESKTKVEETKEQKELTKQIAQYGY